MEAIIAMATSQHNVDLLVLLWRRFSVERNNQLKSMIRKSVIVVADEMHFGKVENIHELAEKYDARLYAETPVGKDTKLGYFTRVGDYPRINYALGRGDAPIEGACVAAELGNVELIEFFLKKGLDPRRSATVCVWAARAGQTETLAWLRSRGFPYTTSVCEAAASRGHLSILHRLRSAGCPWDWKTMSAAAQGGYRDVLEFCYKKQMPLRSRSL